MSPPPDGRLSSTTTWSANGFALSGVRRNSSPGSVHRTIAATSPSAPSTRATIERRFMGVLETAREAAVDQDHGAIDICGTLRAEECRDVADLPRGPKSAKGNRSEIGLGWAVRVHLANAVGVDPPGCDRVHRNALWPELAGQRLRPPDHARADRIREREIVDRLPDRAGGDVHDAATSTLLEVGKAMPGQANHGAEEELRHGRHLFRGDLCCRGSRRPAGVVHDDVDPSVHLD